MNPHIIRALTTDASVQTSLTFVLRTASHVSAAVVDARWLPVPPAGAAGGAPAVDYLQPGGIYRDAALRVVPAAFIVNLALAGPAVLVGDSPFPLGDNGGVGGALVRSLPGRTGVVEVTAAHPVLGAGSVRIAVTPPAPGRRFL